MSHLIKDINLYIQELQQTPSRINSKIHTYYNWVLEGKDKERTLIAARKKWLIMCKGSSIILAAHFSSEIMEASKQWKTFSKYWEKKKLPTKSSLLAKLSFKNEEKVKIFSDKYRLKELITSRSVLQDC